jgi:hypothetical protein
MTSDWSSEDGWREDGRRTAADGQLARLTALAVADFDVLGDVGRVDALIELQRAQSWLDSLQQELLGSIVDHDQTPEQWSREEVGAALRLTPVTAAVRLADAATLCNSLPQTLQSLREGRISATQARALVETARYLPAEVLPELEHRVLTKAESQTAGQLRQSLRRTAIQLAPKHAELKRRAAIDDRHVRLAGEEHGMATLAAYLPADQAKACLARLTGLAKSSTRFEDESTADQRRADALVGALLNASSQIPPSITATIAGDAQHTTRRAGSERGERIRPANRPAVEISVIVGLSTLVGRDEEPGWIRGYGPITAGHARQLSFDPTGTWRRLIVDPVHGQLLDYGRITYKPPQALHDHVVARDGSCTFPTCRIPADRSDLDHIMPFPDGPTSATNLHAAHRRHHNAKTHGGWSVDRDPATGVTTWISPQGRRYPSLPPERWSIPLEAESQ